MDAVPAVQVNQLRKRFGGVQALDGVSFEILPGQVVGFIGANGAGKTTTMRILATLDSSSAGQAFVCGYSVHLQPSEVRKRIGWMPDAYGTYKNTSCLEYLDFFARAYGYAGEEREKRVQDVVDFTELGPLVDRPMTGLSKGQAQRLCLGRTLLHDPEVLILDEPAAGLDPKARIEFKNLVRILSQRGKTILISSHILSELSEMCDSLLFIDKGKIIRSGSADSLDDEAETEYSDIEIRLESLNEEAAAYLQQRHTGFSLHETLKDGFVMRGPRMEHAERAEILKNLVEQGFPIYHFEQRRRKLEDVFIDTLNQQ